MPTSSRPDTDLAVVHTLLQERRTELLASIGQVDDGTVPAAPGTFGETEHLVDAQQREIDGTLVEMFTAELAEVDAAIARIDDGTYDCASDAAPPSPPSGSEPFLPPHLRGLRLGHRQDLEEPGPVRSSSNTADRGGTAPMPSGLHRRRG